MYLVYGTWRSKTGDGESLRMRLCEVALSGDTCVSTAGSRR